MAHTARAEFAKADVARWLRLGGAEPAVPDGVHVTLDGTADASGTFESLDTLSVTVALDRLSGNIRGKPVALAAPTVVRWTRGAVDPGVSTVSVGGATIAVTPVEGTPDASTVTVAAPLSDILALLPPGSIPPGIVADGGLRVEARVPHADPRHPSVQASASIADVTKDATRVAQDVRAEGRLDGDRLVLSMLKGTVIGAMLDLTGTAPVEWFAPGLMSARASSSSSAVPPGARLSGTINAPVAAVLDALGLQTKDLSGAVLVSVDLGASALSVKAISGVITSDSMTLQTRTGTFTGDGPGLVRIAKGFATIESFAVKGPDSRIQASGRVELASGGTVDVRVAARRRCRWSMPLSRLA